MPQQTIIIPSADIDKKKWDDCVLASLHQNIFMYSWALDALCDNWSGLILDDYEAVFPLPWRNKAMLKYVYQVPFMSMLSVMTKSSLAEPLLAKKDLQKHFSLIHTDTDSNIFPGKWIIKKRTNYQLSLEAGYGWIRENSYSGSCKKNIQKAVSRGCSFSTAGNLQLVFDMYDKAYGKLQANHTNNDYNKATLFAEQAIKRNMATVYTVEHTVSKEILFSAIVLNDKNRLYYWLGAPSPEGRKARATYFFIDGLIQQFAGTETMLDFEGSDIASVAAFYQQFGPQATTYYEIKKLMIV